MIGVRPPDMPADKKRYHEAKPLYVIQKDKLRCHFSVVWETKDGQVFWAVGNGTGKLVWKTTEYKAGKGKRTKWEQALLEQESDHTKKIKKGKYVEDRDKATTRDAVEFPPPMLATAYTNNKGKVMVDITFPCYVQRKLDGNRGPARVMISGDNKGEVKIWSREGNFFTGYDHIEKELTRIASNKDVQKHARKLGFKNNIIFDGELYTRELPWEDLNGALKSINDTPDLVAKRAMVQFWWFDLAIPKVSMKDRFATMMAMAGEVEMAIADDHVTAAEYPVVIEQCVMVRNMEELRAFHEEAVKACYEGTIIRAIDGTYEWDKRSKDIIKYKDFVDEEFTVRRVEENERLAGTGKFVLDLPDGRNGKDEFTALPDGSEEFKAALLRHPEKWIGKKVTVRYQNRSYKYNVPRFPVARPFEVTD